MRHLIIILIAFPLFTFAQSFDSFGLVDSIISEIDPKGPGVAIGIVQEDKLSFSVTKGMANLDYNLPISNSTNFRLSSSSKQFTAACIILLAEQKRLKLEDELSKFFPEFSENIGNVTVRQLLNHTSGIRDYMSLLMLKGSRQMDFFNSFIGEDRDIMDVVSNQKGLSFDSGVEHSYSNTNYWILGEIVGKITGKSLGDYAKANIFMPLKMTNTSYVERTGQLVPNRAAGYVSECPDCPREEYRFQAATVGDGGVVSSIDDLVLWENEFHNQNLFSKKFWSMMLTNGVLENGKEISYASGLIKGEQNGQKMISHSGQNPGFSSDLIRFPDHNLSIIILANQNWYDIRSYAMQIANSFFPPKDKPKKSAENQKLKPIKLTPVALDKFVGDYRFIETNEHRTIKRNQNQLFYVRNNGPTSKLVPLGENKLTFEDRPNVILTFDFKNIQKKNIVWNDGPITLHAESYTKTLLDVSELNLFSQKYRNDELDLEFRLKMEDDQLVFPIFNQKLPLEAVKKDEFNAMGMFTLRFERSKTGKIIGFNLDAPRAANIAFTKIE